MREYRDFVEELIKNRDEASSYMTAALEEYENDGNLPALLQAIRTVVEAQGGIGVIATKTGLSRQHLYRSLSRKGNPTIRTLDTLFLSLGFKLTFTRAS